VNESHRKHRENPFKYPRRNLPTGERLTKLQNKRTTGDPSGNSHQRRAARRKAARKPA
jgi:hypothetical protein